MLESTRCTVEGSILFFSAPRRPSVGEPKIGNPLHQTCSRVSEKSTARFEGAIHSDMMFWSHEKIGGLGRMVGGLFGDVVAFRVVWILPPTGEGLAEYGIEWLLDSSRDTC
jgi:hypothetical protein